MKNIVTVLVCVGVLGLLSFMIADMSGGSYQMSIIFGWVNISAILLMWAYLTVHEEHITIQQVVVVFSSIAIGSAAAYIWMLEGGDPISTVAIIETVKVLTALLVSIKRDSQRLSSGKILLGILAAIIMIDGTILMLAKQWFDVADRIFLTIFCLPSGLATLGLIIKSTKKPKSIKKDSRIDLISKRIGCISKLEGCAAGQRRGLEFCFFPLAGVVIWLYIRQITTPLTETNHGATIVANIIFILLAFVVIISAGYISHWLLGKRLDSLWKEKQKFILD